MESYTNISNTIIDDENLDPYEKTVLIYLVRLNNKTLGYSFPKKETMENVLKISPKKLTKTLRALQEKGYITISKREGKAGKNNIYYIDNKYLVGQQDDVQTSKKINTNNNPSKNKKHATGANTKDYHNNNYPVKTKYHDTFNEHFRDYTPDELEHKLLMIQAKKRGTN